MRKDFAPASSSALFARRARELAMLVLVFAGSCSGASSSPSEEATRPPREETHVVPNERPRPSVPEHHMVELFDRLASVRHGVVDGDLESLRAPAAWLARVQAPKVLPASWSSYYPKVRKAAQGLLSSRSLDEAAMHTARIGRMCGECHESTGANLMFVASKRPAADSNMLVHAWAVVRLWDGLITAREDAWREGAAELLGANLGLGDIAKSDPNSPEKPAPVQALRKEAERASVAVTWTTRTKAMARVLATCAGCHSSAR